MEPQSGLEPRSLILVIQCLNHLALVAMISSVVAKLEEQEGGKSNIIAAAPTKNKHATKNKKRNKGKLLNVREYLTSENDIPSLRLRMKMSKERALGKMCKILDKVSGAKSKTQAKLDRARKDFPGILKSTLLKTCLDKHPVSCNFEPLTSLLCTQVCIMNDV